MNSLLKDSIIHIINNYSKFFLSKKNVVGMSFGNKSIKNINSKEPVLRILVKEKIHLNKLYKQDIIPKNFLGIKTDVFKVGNLNTCQKSITGLDKLKKDIKFLNSYQRPLQGGLSISPANSDYSGTLGGIVFHNETNKPYILSNNHVLSDQGKYPVNTSIVQPANSSYKWISINHKMAKLKKIIPIHYKNSDLDKVENQCDAAIARINSNNKFIPQIYYIGPVYGISKANENSLVKKTGAKTAHTIGFITDTNVLIDVNMSNGLTATFKDQIIATEMSEPGDSGSLVLNDFNKVVGLLFASSNEISIFSPIKYILDTFNVHF